MKELIIKIPKGYMNVGISNSNKLIADTNDSSNWDEIYFPLPKGKWNIEKIDVQTNIIKLIKRNKMKQTEQQQQDNGDLVLLIWQIEKLRRREGGCTMNELIAEAKKNFEGIEHIKKK